MEKYGLLGCPLGHSLSPFIHKCLFEASGKPCSYDLFEISENDLPARAAALKELGGFNVTIPHKINIIQYLDGLDERPPFGAVNTVKTAKVRWLQYGLRRISARA